MSRLRIASVLVLAVVTASSAWAQTSSLTGRVVDPQGGAVVGASVTLQGTSLPRPLNVRSTPEGTFTFDQVAQAAYVLEVEAPGFVPWRQEITTNGSAQTLNVTLQIAGITEDVTVSGSAPVTLSKPAPVASRLGLTPLETPASVQVMSGELIRERGDVTVFDANTRAVGVTTQWTVGNGGGGLNVRGFSTVNSVLQMYDGVQLFIGGGTVSFPFDPWTVDRVEVMGGPGSVLYGNGAIGGVVNVVPRRPNRASYQHAARVTFGSFDTIRAAVDTTGPIGNRLSYRMAVSHNKSDNFIERGESKTTAFSGALRADVSPTFNVTLTEDYGTQRPMNYYGMPLINNQPDRSLRSRNFNLGDADTYYRDNLTQVKGEWVASPTVTVRSVGYYVSAERLWHRIGNYVYQPATNLMLRSSVLDTYHHERQYGNHSDVVVNKRLGGLDNRVSFGFDYNWVRFQHVNNSPSLGTSLVPLDNPNPGLWANLALSRTVPAYQTYTHAGSAFAEDRLVLNSRLSLVTGLRYDITDVDRRDLILNTTSDKTFKPVTGRAGLVYNPMPKVALYGQVTTGTDAIGNVISQTPAQQFFDLSTGRQIEVGAKQSFLGDRAEWTVAYYDIVKKKLQVPDPNNPALSQQVGQQSSSGVEVSAMFPLGGGARVEANGTLLKAQFDDFSEVVSGALVSRNGKRPPSVPTQAANLWVTWDPSRQLQLRSGLRYVGQRYINNANTWIMPAYTVIDSGVRVRTTDRTAVDLRVFNAFDQFYVRGFWNGNTTAPQWLLGTPRTVELSVTANF